MLSPQMHTVSQQLGNYDHLFRAVELSRLPFKITGDLHFIMPCFGLLGCSSSNPCVYCPRERRRIGGVAKWEEGDVELRTLGSLNQNYADWFEEGQRDGAQFTRKFKSVAGPILVEGAGDSFSTLVLDKAPPCALHLFLATNDCFNHLQRNHWPDFKVVLLNLYGIQAHSYQGKEQNYQGPEIRKVLSGLHKLMPLMRDDPIRRLYLEVLLETSRVNEAIFGLELNPSWRQLLHQLKVAVLALNAATSFPITPKYHIILEHVGQWVERHGRSLGKEAEQAGSVVYKSPFGFLYFYELSRFGQFVKNTFLGPHFCCRGSPFHSKLGPHYK